MRRLALFMMIVLLTVTGVSAQGQDSIDIAISDDLGILNPLVLANPNVTPLIWSRLFDVDTTTGTFVSAVANWWEISSDGLTYTIHLGDDQVWSDGTPITAMDVAFALQAVRSESLASPLNRALPPEIFDTFTVVDNQTFSFTIARPNCSVLTRFNAVIPLPSHLFAEDFSDVADNRIFTQNGVSSGPYTVVASTPGDSLELVANPNYRKGAPLIPNVTLHIIPDAEEALQALADGSIDVWSSITPLVTNTTGEVVALADSVTPALTADERDRLAEETGIPLPENMKLFRVPGVGVVYLVMNTADPENPQPRYDTFGSRIDQGVHPIFGDVRVRRAVTQAVDVAAMLLHPTNGNLVTPQSWAFDPGLDTYPFNIEEAAAFLEEAGWTDEDGDGVRECHGCLYAEEGEPLVFDLSFAQTRPETGWVAEAVQQQLAAVGAEVTIASHPVEPGVLDPLLNQAFDMALISLGSFPTDPSFVFDSLLLSSSDIPGRGFNIASYANDEVDQLLVEARHVPGCEPEARAELYREAQATILGEPAYIPLGILATNHVANDRLDGFDPAVGQPFSNIETWSIGESRQLPTATPSG